MTPQRKIPWSKEVLKLSAIVGACMTILGFAYAASKQYFVTHEQGDIRYVNKEVHSETHKSQDSSIDRIERLSQDSNDMIKQMVIQHNNRLLR